MSDGDDFVSVTHKKKPSVNTNKKRKGRANRPRERTVAERVEARQIRLTSSGYLEQCRELLRATFDSQRASTSANDQNKFTELSSSSICPKPSCIVCLGLGSVAESSKSQDQFVLLQAIQDELKEYVNEKVEIYDPAFSELDIEYFTEQRLRPRLTEHSLSLDETTLLFMPHCPRSLFDKLLRTLWSKDRLGKLVLLGNRLDLYDDPTYSGGASRARSPFIAKSVSLFQIVPLPTMKDHLEAFNDLALQWIPQSVIDAQSEAFWAFADEFALNELKPGKDFPPEKRVYEISLALEKVEI